MGSATFAFITSGPNRAFRGVFDSAAFPADVRRLNMYGRKQIIAVERNTQASFRTDVRFEMVALDQLPDFPVVRIRGSLRRPLSFY